MNATALHAATDRLQAAYEQARGELLDALDEMPDGDWLADKILRRTERLIANAKLWGVTLNHVRSLKRWTEQLRERKALGFTENGQSKGKRRFADFALKRTEPTE